MDSGRFGIQVISENIEEPVFFNSRGNKLFGILHKAENRSRNVGVIFLNSGLQYRVGPHRMYVKIARRLSLLGFPVLRFDFPGIGESEGTIQEVHFDLFDTEDTLRAIDFFVKEENIKAVVLLGICSGARNALMTAANDQRVDSIISLSLPIISDSQKYSEDKLSTHESISVVAANAILKRWMVKSFSLKAWRKYFSNNTSSLSLKSVLFKILTGKKSDEDIKFRKFFEAFKIFISSKRRALFVYGERNFVPKGEFEVKFKELSEGKEHLCDYYIVPDGDHTFTLKDAERDVIEKTVEWLTQCYPSTR